MSQTMKTALQVRVTEAEREAFRAIAAQRGVSVSDVVRGVLDGPECAQPHCATDCRALVDA